MILVFWLSYGFSVLLFVDVFPHSGVWRPFKYYPACVCVMHKCPFDGFMKQNNQQKNHWAIITASHHFTSSSSLFVCLFWNVVVRICWDQTWQSHNSMSCLSLLNFYFLLFSTSMIAMPLLNSVVADSNKTPFIKACWIERLSTLSETLNLV